MKSKEAERQIITKLQKTAEKEIKNIITEAVKELDQKGTDLGEVEKRIRQKALHLGGDILEASIAIHGTGYKGSRIKCRCGGKKRFIGNRKKKISTLLKDIFLNRAYYGCDVCKESLIPLDKKLKIENTTKSPGVKEMVCIVAAEKSFEGSKRLLEKLAAIKISKETIRLISEKIGRVIEKENKTEVDDYYWDGRRREIPEDSLSRPEHIYVSADGTCVNTLQGWKEVKSGVVFDAQVEKGEPVRGTTTYLGGFENSQNFMRRLYVESYKRGIDKAKNRIAIGDGAKWIWNEVETNFPDADKIVDFYHASERIWDTAKSLHGEDESKVKAFVKPYLKYLAAGEIGKITKGFTHAKTSAETKDKIQETVNYYTNNQDKMRYKKFKQKGYFIGSGAVEGSCKHAVGERLKRSGMRWSIDGGNAILQLRNCCLNDRWDNFWCNHLSAS